MEKSHFLRIRVAYLTVFYFMAISDISVEAFPYASPFPYSYYNNFHYLNPNFYYNSCPTAMEIIKKGVEKAVADNPRMAASLLRLHFHDCFVQGCDASILLDDDPSLGIVSEKNARPNANSVRGFEVIDGIKAELEKACPRTVSCADIIAVAARDSVALSGGVGWEVGLGRRDSKSANLSASNNNLPAPNSALESLVAKFQAQGLEVVDMVALSGSHTIGLSRCAIFRQRLYNEDDTDNKLVIEPEYLARVSSYCPRSGGDDNLSALDEGSPTQFDGSYFKNLVQGKGLLISDQVLYPQSSSPQAQTLSLEWYVAQMVERYANNEQEFLNQFAASMVKMGNINPLLFPNGEVRTSCRSVNPSY